MDVIVHSYPNPTYSLSMKRASRFYTTEKKYIVNSSLGVSYTPKRDGHNTNL